MTTLAKALAGLSLGSVKPKLAALKVWLPSSLMVTEPLVPAGASLTGATLIVTVAFAEFADPSFTRKVKLPGSVEVQVRCVGDGGRAR